MWMLEKDPEERPDPKNALKHPWFQSDISILKDLLRMNSVAL